jgi:F-box/leucine-rich repeat protein 7
MEGLSEASSRRSSILSDQGRVSTFSDVIGRQIPEAPKNRTDSSSDEEETSENDALPPAIRNRNLAVLAEPRRRRASVAVWADSRLSELSNAIVNGRTKERSRMAAKMSTESLATAAESDEMEVDLPAAHTPVATKRTPLGDEDCLKVIMSSLSFKDCWILRRTNRLWLNTLRKASNVLGKVDLSGTNKRIDDVAVANIARFCGSNLDVLCLKNCWRVTNVGLKEIACSSPQLRVLDVSGCWELGDEGLASLSVGCRGLRSIDISSCRKVTDAGIYNLTHNCSNLLDIIASYCKALSNVSMSYLASAHHNVRRLNLQRCIGINDEGFEMFGSAQHFKLYELILSDCSFLTDTTIVRLASSCPNLRILNLSFCCTLTEACFTHLASGCARLKILDVSFCGAAVSDDTLQTIGIFT